MGSDTVWCANPEGNTRHYLEQRRSADPVPGQTVILTLSRIEALLEDFVKEARNGQRARTVLSAHETDDYVVWRTLEQELAEEGISTQGFPQHREAMKSFLGDLCSKIPADFADSEN
jgi:hypothetical protein